MQDDFYPNIMAFFNDLKIKQKATYPDRMNKGEVSTVIDLAIHATNSESMGGGIKGYDKLLEQITRRMSLDHGEEAVIRSLKQIITQLEKIAEYARQLDEEEAGCKSNEASY
ncbi:MULTISPECIES: hypothetical protein [unclassified Desulfobacter]|jgi:hypothetical protein|uniref:hypothetical protein n=1 Tax=unclassified Desulfobacter TaxID=2634406 RepID=UPI000E8560A2|nr:MULTISPECIES: hypothetical protein [unclassified Desulfobacter]HBT89672.1 hypothetical protein [Desulfobacter sp.]HRF91581.1 hypothetical protein [Desulfobacter postgatei]